jgi:hypothetical protein
MNIFCNNCKLCKKGFCSLFETPVMRVVIKGTVNFLRDSECRNLEDIENEHDCLFFSIRDPLLS